MVINSGKVPRPKHRAGVLPTKREKDKSKTIPREDKYKEKL
jgi:hypothetical protein